MAHESASTWPSLRVEDWGPTRDTLHMWTQIVGKVRLAHAPLVNHWWQVTLYVTPRVLNTSAIPYGSDVFDIEFDFIDHRLMIRSSSGAAGPLRFGSSRWRSSTPRSCRCCPNWACKRTSSLTPTRWSPPYRSPTMSSTLPMTRRPPTCSGGNWCRRTACWAGSDPGLSARSAPCISFGEQWILPVRDSPAEAPRRTPEAHPTAATG